MYHKYIMHRNLKKYMDLRYHGTENFTTVSKKVITVLLNFSILLSHTAYMMCL